MSDRLPGSSWSNPIWHGRWRIYAERHAGPIGTAFAFVHDDYDGADDGGDNRCGFAPTLADAKRQIDEINAENGVTGCDNHTPAAQGYIQFHDWAQRIGPFHTQRACQDCGRYAIWEAKA